MVTEEDLLEASTRIARDGARLDDVIMNERDLVALIGEQRLEELLASGRARRLGLDTVNRPQGGR